MPEVGGTALGITALVHKRLRLQVCHEETLGDYASLTNIQEGTPELGGQLWCDYKMVRMAICDGLLGWVVCFVL